MIAEALRESARAHLDLAERYEAPLKQVARELTDALTNGRRVYLCGNGGSAADAQHVAAELVGRFKRERKPYPALALTTDTSALTALVNDYPPEAVFARQVSAHARRGDVVVCISTSGRSQNILAALATAHVCEAVTIGFTGSDPGPMAGMCDVLFEAPSQDTARIQELHITAWHAVLAEVERHL